MTLNEIVLLIGFCIGLLWGMGIGILVIHKHYKNK